MADVDLADIRKQCIESLYLCANNVSKYMDSEKDAEFTKLRNCVREYCLMEEMQDFQNQALAMAQREIDASTLNELDDKYSAHLNSMQSKVNVDRHPFMVKFEKIRRQERPTTSNLDQSDLVITETQETYRDPITKKPIENPVRNTMCGHVYEKSAILGHIQRKRAKCPVVGCGNTEPVLKEHLVVDEELTLQIQLQTSCSSRNTSRMDVDMDSD